MGGPSLAPRGPRRSSPDLLQPLPPGPSRLHAHHQAVASQRWVPTSSSGCVECKMRAARQLGFIGTSASCPEHPAQPSHMGPRRAPGASQDHPDSQQILSGLSSRQAGAMRPVARPPRGGGTGHPAQSRAGPGGIRRASASVFLPDRCLGKRWGGDAQGPLSHVCEPWGCPVSPGAQASFPSPTLVAEGPAWFLETAFYLE